MPASSQSHSATRSNNEDNSGGSIEDDKNFHENSHNSSLKTHTEQEITAKKDDHLREIDEIPRDEETMIRYVHAMASHLDH